MTQTWNLYEPGFPVFSDNRKSESEISGWLLQSDAQISQAPAELQPWRATWPVRENRCPDATGEFWYCVRTSGLRSQQHTPALPRDTKEDMREGERKQVWQGSGRLLPLKVMWRSPEFWGTNTRQARHLLSMMRRSLLCQSIFTRKDGRSVF